MRRRPIPARWRRSARALRSPRLVAINTDAGQFIAALGRQSGIAARPAHDPRPIVIDAHTRQLVATLGRRRGRGINVVEVAQRGLTATAMLVFLAHRQQIRVQTGWWQIGNAAG
jgi:hypothetical protein